MATGIGGEIGWWCPSLDDTGNGTLILYDLAGSNDGTLTNMDTGDWVADTDSGGIRALDFDGIDDHVSPVLASTALPLTISVWVKQDIAGAECPIGVFDSTTGSRYHIIYVDGVGNAIANSRNGGNASSTKSGFTVGNWHHLLAVFASATSRTVYLDGVAGAENTSNFGPGGLDVVGIGRMSDLSPSLYFDGLIDDVRIYDRVLTAGDITNLASKRGYQPASTASNLLIRRNMAAGFSGMTTGGMIG